MSEDELYRKAEKRVEEKLGFYHHLYAFIAVNVVFFLMNLIFSPSKKISPSLGLSILPIKFNKVDLPLPDLPSMQISPREGNEREICLMTYFFSFLPTR